MPERIYDEQSVKRRYLWAYFSALCSDGERAVYKAHLGRLKATNAPLQEKMLRRMFGDWGDPTIASELSEGFDVFTDRVLLRIENEYPELLYLNLCEQCNRIVGTPMACICGWCGHNWFSRRDEQDGIAERALKRAERCRDDRS